MLLLLGPFIALCKRSRLVHWAQDIYPEVAEEVGVLPRRGLVAKICRMLSNFALKRNFKIVSIGRCMKQRLVGRGIPPRLIEMIPNWPVGAAARNSAADGLAFRAEHKLWGKFVVMYSGNFGLAHSFDELIDAAKNLQLLRPDILFALIGEGPRLAALKEKTTELGIANMLFLPAQPIESLSETLCGADVHLASMREEVCGLVVPSKIYGVFSAGRPCIFIGPSQSEAALLVAQNQCGTVVGCHDPASLINAIVQWADDPQALKAAGARARAAAPSLASTTQAFARVLRGGPGASAGSLQRLGIIGPLDDGVD